MQNEPNFENAVGDAQPTTAKDWKGKRLTQGVPVTVPSGNVALCRRPGIDVFMKMGMVPNSLMGIIQKQIAKAQKGEKISEKDLNTAMAKMAEDPTKLADVFEFADKVTVFITIEPKVLEAPPEGEARDPNALYVDEVDTEDKLFLFQWAVGGTESLEAFRAELSEGVGDSRSGESVDGSTE